MAEHSSFTKDAALERFLKNLPEDVASSFNLEQLQAMQSALQATQWRKHPIDIRLSVPILWKTFYVVLVAGPERRSRQRLIAERSKNPIWTYSNMIFAVMLVCVGMLASLGLFQLKNSSLNTLQNLEVHPAGIPFKADRKSCEESNRVWKNGECFDYNHDPTF